MIVDQSVMLNKRDNLSSQATDKQEIEANQFAAEILMPKYLMDAAIERLAKAGIGSRDDFISALARYFHELATHQLGRVVQLNFTG